MRNVFWSTVNRWRGLQTHQDLGPKREVGGAAFPSFGSVTRRRRVVKFSTSPHHHPGAENEVGKLISRGGHEILLNGRKEKMCVWTTLVWYLLVLPYTAANMTSFRAIDGNTSYHLRESFSFECVLLLGVPRQSWCTTQGRRKLQKFAMGLTSYTPSRLHCKFHIFLRLCNIHHYI